MKKFLIFILVILIAPFIAGIYGILHDQLTYSISPEYYTKFKFIQFGLVDSGSEAHFPYPRFEVSIVGFMATWWMGLPIGIILSLVGLVHKTYKRMLKVTLRAILIAVLATFLTGLIGLAYGKLYLADAGVNWWLPQNLVDTKNFIVVGSMHNFSYLGGILGLIIGVIFSLKQKDKKTI
tara:strand:+ start:69 stop:605 length:537 start_codon:yes stop_codon:yes gene_type:complete